MTKPDGRTLVRASFDAALLAPDPLERARVAGLVARQEPDVHDAWGYLDAIGDLVVTGPTRTHVDDYRAILVL